MGNVSFVLFVDESEGLWICWDLCSTCVFDEEGFE